MQMPLTDRMPYSVATGSGTGAIATQETEKMYGVQMQTRSQQHDTEPLCVNVIVCMLVAQLNAACLLLEAFVKECFRGLMLLLRHLTEPSKHC